MPTLSEGPKHAAAPETYEDVFEYMQHDAETFAEEMRAAGAHSEVGFEDVQPYLRHDPSKSHPVLYYAVRSTTKYGGRKPLAGRCHEWEEEGSGSAFFQTARNISLELAFMQRSSAARTETRSIAILRASGKLAIATEHLHGDARQRQRVSTWNLSPREVLDEGLKNGLVSADAVLQTWTRDLVAARDTYLRG